MRYLAVFLVALMLASPVTAKKKPPAEPPPEKVISMVTVQLCGVTYGWAVTTTKRVIMISVDSEMPLDVIAALQMEAGDNHVFANIKERKFCVST